MEVFFSALIVFNLRFVDGAVEFDDNLKMQAAEVGDARTNRMLPAKFESIELLVAESFPEHPFSWCHCLSQRARIRDTRSAHHHITCHVAVKLVLLAAGLQDDLVAGGDDLGIGEARLRAAEGCRRPCALGEA